MRLTLGSLRAWLALTGAMVMIAGCAGVFGGESLRQTNSELVIVHYGSLRGEIKECG